MSSFSPPSTAEPPKGPRTKTSGISGLWHRVSEGRRIDDLMQQFAADARASYGFYGHDVDWEQIQKLPRWRRPFHIAKQFFWALLMKLSPARRILLLFSTILLFVSGLKFRYGEKFSFDVDFTLIAALLFLLLLSLELADKVTMKRDLEIAREIQLWLVPSESPTVPGADIAFATRPQNSVAGDYYDAFFPSNDGPDGKLLLVIADVAGKSVPAAILMATLQASLRTIASERTSLGELVTRLNRYACAHSLGGLRFTTAVIGEYDPTSRQLTYVNAGHNAPILHHTNDSLELLEIGGLPLGIEPSATYETTTLQLQPGEALIFFTDGVVEAFNQAGEEFGNKRWLAAIRTLPQLSAHQTLQFLMKHVDDFVGTTRQSDDITCMIFRST